jgi:Sulfatase
MFTRRALLRNTAAGAVAAATETLFAQRNTPPNIVFILADDLGYADISCYGRPDLSTPNIDALAARGVRFLQAYANSAVCSATRTALITGRYQDRLTVGLDEPLTTRAVGLPPEHPTLPSLRNLALCKAATTIFMAFAAALWIITAIAGIWGLRTCGKTKSKCIKPVT